MRRTTTRRHRWLAACAASASSIALLSGLLATPAGAVTNLYAAQASGTVADLLSQFAVAPDGSLTPLAPAPLGPGAQDLAITPDGRFAYVTRSPVRASGLIAQFARGAGGAMVPNGSVAAGTEPGGILVNPQGTRVYYTTAVSPSLHSRPIAADGGLGAITSVATTPGVPRFVAMSPGGTSLYVSVAGQSLAVTGFRQYDVDPASGAIAAKPVPFVPWPGGGPAEVTRMTVSPDGRHLYAASGVASSGIARFGIDGSGALTDGTLVAVPADASATSVLALAPAGLFAWAPTSDPGVSPPGQIAQFTRDPATGALFPLFLPAVDYRPEADLPARDAVASPDGTSLYLGQDANVGAWTITSGGALLPRTNHPGAIAGALNAGLALAPSQAPVASFTASPAPAGQATTFDAAASSDPDGTVVRYDWDFGDATGLANGGPAPSHVYSTAGSRVVQLTVTDADGTSTAQLWTGARMLRNGGPSAHTTRSVLIPAAPGPPPPPPPPPPAAEKGKSVTVATASGRVRVRVPGASRYVDLARLTEIPLGSRVDTRSGRVRLTAEVDARTHATQSSLFYAGIFQVAQTKGSKPILVASIIGGTFAGCQPRRAPGAVARLALGGPLARPFRYAAAAKRKRSKRVVRRLWGKGTGDFRTTGKRSTATVRGTWWLVEDRCDGTLTRVREGRVDVRDIRLKKTIRLRAGGRSVYLAKAP